MEYRAVAVTVAETLFMRHLLADLGLFLKQPTRIMCDNISATYMAVNPVLRDRSKHIAVDYLFVREQVANVNLAVKFVPTKFQLGFNWQIF